MSYEDSNRFTEDDVIKALEMYNENFVTFPREDVAKYSGIPIPPNKRNWRKQSEHLKIARFTKEIMKDAGNLKKEGHPSKEQIIRDYMIAHPDIKKKTEIAEALQINRHTVGKYYDSILAKIEQQHEPKEPQKKIVIENGKIVIKLVPSQELSDQLLDAVKLS